MVDKVEEVNAAPVIVGPGVVGDWERPSELTDSEVVPVVGLVDTGSASHSSAILAAPEVTDLKQYS